MGLLPEKIRWHWWPAIRFSLNRQLLLLIRLLVKLSFLFVITFPLKN